MSSLAKVAMVGTAYLVVDAVRDGMACPGVLCGVKLGVWVCAWHTLVGLGVKTEEEHARLKSDKVGGQGAVADRVRDLVWAKNQQGRMWWPYMENMFY